MRLYYQHLSQQTSRRWFWALLVLISLFRLIFASHAGLGVDESHYVLFGRHLAWGYMDHPPMVAFVAALTAHLTSLPLAARIGAIACGMLATYLTRLLILELYKDERLALAALLVLAVLPYQHLLMVALLPDAPLALFWCGSLLFFWKAVQEDRSLWWFLTGLGFGGCLLSKYHGILLPACLFLYLLFSPQYRFHLLKAKPWLAVLTGLLVFLPNILWNYQHNWISYRFQLSRGGGEHISIDRVFEVLGVQLGVWSPLMVMLLWSALASLLLRPKGEADRFLFWTSAPVFVFFYGIGMSSSILPHWVAVGWWTGSAAIAVAVSRIFAEKKEPSGRWLMFIQAATCLGLAMSVLVYSGLSFSIIGPLYGQIQKGATLIHTYLPSVRVLPDFTSEKDITNELFGWDQAGAEVARLLQSMPRPEKTFIVSDRFYTISQLGVYLPNNTVTTTLRSQWDQHRLWHAAQSLAGWDALYIDDNRFPADPKPYSTLFTHTAAEPVTVSGLRGTQPVRRLTVYRMYGYRDALLP